MKIFLLVHNETKLESLKCYNFGCKLKQDKISG